MGTTAAHLCVAYNFLRVDRWNIFDLIVSVLLVFIAEHGEAPFK